ncbi:MAG: MBL fold metallo-hydrolase [Pseudomonadota bacterium]|uniref:MBL fold metallo-hydrolase n=1 Tax=Phenylobacterium sp. TaxID=1871053 RepID=UPI002600A662|nr:MBL fold metallo-hydrolase [Phenylobacterium sp.]MBT9471124.1 MBL fold metallo-hydrolase [Phenylobacterium sp.]
MAGPSLIALAAAAVLVGAGAPSAGTAGPPAVVRVTTLGTNGGAILNKGRAQPANLLEVDGKAYLIDAGAGTLRQLAQVGVSPMRIDQIFITHNHIDHNADWPLLMAHAYVVGRRTPMTVLGPGGTVHMRDAFLSFLEPIAETAGRAPPPADALKEVFRAQDIGEGLVFADDRVRVTAIENCHYHPAPGAAAQPRQRSYALRFEARGKVVVFSGDTGPCEARLAPFARGADLLIHEVIDVPAVLAVLRTQAGVEYSQAQWAEIEAHMREDHTTPEEVGRLAAAAGVKTVVLSHIVPGSGGDPKAYAAEVRKHFSGPVIVAEDLQVFD